MKPKTFRDAFGDKYNEYYHNGNIFIESRIAREITSLEGAPRVVTGYFNCDVASIKSFEGAPIYVGGYFSCEHAPNLTSLEGFPKYCGSVWVDKHHFQGENLYTILASQLRQQLYTGYSKKFFRGYALRLLVRYFTEE
jgi:hypothetical protein